MRLSASARERESTKTNGCGSAVTRLPTGRTIPTHRARLVAARRDTSLLSVAIQRVDYIDSLRTRHGDPDALILYSKTTVVGPFRASFVAIQTQPWPHFSRLGSSRAVNQLETC
jgi:hypothetical protein